MSAELSQFGSGIGIAVSYEEPGDPDISVNRIFSITPLEEIYGQSKDPLE